MDKLLIEIPEGCSGIDIEKSDLDKGIIIFKKKQEFSWKDNAHIIEGFYIDNSSRIIKVSKGSGCTNQYSQDRNVFATEKQAKSIINL